MQTTYILEDKIPVPCDDMKVWGEFMGGDCSVANTYVLDVNISTVFLGIDNGFGDGAPILFETMIFGGEHDNFQQRYWTWEEAEKGHKAAVELVEGGI